MGTRWSDFAELAADIAAEAEQAPTITDQIEDLDERIASLYSEADPKHLVASSPGVGPVLAGVILGRLGDARRFRDFSAVGPGTRSPGVPGLRSSGPTACRMTAFTGELQWTRFCWSAN